MIKKMTVKQFVNNYSELKTKQSQEKYIKENLKIREYIPFNLKSVLAKNIVDCSSFDKDKNLKLSSPTRYLLYIRTIITQYTNLTENTEYSPFLDEYDSLASTGLLDLITKKIPEKELTEFKTIVDMILNDTITQYTSPQIFVSEQIQRFISLISQISEPLITQISNALEKFDEKDIEKFNKKFGLFFKK